MALFSRVSRADIFYAVEKYNKGLYRLENFELVVETANGKYTAIVTNISGKSTDEELLSIISKSSHRTYGKNAHFKMTSSSPMEEFLLAELTIEVSAIL